MGSCILGDRYVKPVTKALAHDHAVRFFSLQLLQQGQAGFAGKNIPFIKINEGQ
jgi:hypothetical protein